MENRIPADITFLDAPMVKPDEGDVTIKLEDGTEISLKDLKDPFGEGSDEPPAKR